MTENKFACPFIKLGLPKSKLFGLLNFGLEVIFVGYFFKKAQIFKN